MGLKETCKIIQISGRTLFATNDYSKAALQRCSYEQVFSKFTANLQEIYWNHTSAFVFCCKFAVYFQNTFSSEHLWMAALDYLLLEPCQQYVIAKYKARLDYTRSAKPIFISSSLWNKQNFRSSYFWLHLIVWAVTTLWRNSCKTRCPQKNICGGVLSYCNLNFKIFKVKLKVKIVSRDVIQS